MGTLALVYIDVTKHIVASTLVQSGYSAAPQLEDLVGTGPRIRDAGTNAVAINVASSAVGLKVAVFDTAFFAKDRTTLDGLLNDPLDYCLQLKDPTDPNSPLIPSLAQTTLGLSFTSGTTGAKIHQANAAPAALAMLMLVQRGSIDSPPQAPPAVSIPAGPPPAADRNPLVVLQSNDWAWLLVETQEPVLQQIL